MHPQPTAIYVRTLPLIAAGWLLIFFTIGLTNGTRPPPTFVIGCVFATLLQHAVLAAAWCALGPGPTLLRFPLSFAWAFLQGLAMTAALGISGNQSSNSFGILIAVALWLAALGPTWGVALFFRLRLWHQGTPPQMCDRPGQFGIRQLMVFTAIVAALLGAGRLVVESGWFERFIQHEWKLFGFLIVAQIIMGLPLIFALLLPRNVVLGVAANVLLIGLVTASEGPLMSKLLGPSAGPPQELPWVLFWLNFLSVLWTFAFAGVVRWSGYHLGVPEIAPALQPKLIEATPFKSSDAPAPHAPAVQSADSVAGQ